MSRNPFGCSTTTLRLPTSTNSEWGTEYCFPSDVRMINGPVPTRLCRISSRFTKEVLATELISVKKQSRINAIWVNCADSDNPGSDESGGFDLELGSLEVGRAF